MKARPVHKSLEFSISATACGTRGSHAFAMSWANVTCLRCLRTWWARLGKHQCNERLGFDPAGKCNWCGRPRG